MSDAQAFAALAVLVGLLVGLIVFVRVVFRVVPPEPIVLGVPPSKAVDGVAGYMVSNGFTIAQIGETTATFVRPKKPNTDVGVLLLLLGIIPGLLYFGLFRGTQTTSIHAAAATTGTTLTLSGDDVNGRDMLERWARQDAVRYAPGDAAGEATMTL